MIAAFRRGQSSKDGSENPPIGTNDASSKTGVFETSNGS